MRFQPACEPDVRNARSVVRVIVRQQQRIDPTDRNAELIEPDRGAAPGVDQQLLVARLDERAWTEPIGTGIGVPVPSSVTRKSAGSRH